jgi:hypothetical protein
MSVKMQNLTFGFRPIKTASHSHDKQHNKMGLFINTLLSRPAIQFDGLVQILFLIS